AGSFRTAEPTGTALAAAFFLVPRTPFAVAPLFAPRTERALLASGWALAPLLPRFRAASEFLWRKFSAAARRPLAIRRSRTRRPCRPLKCLFAERLALPIRWPAVVRLAIRPPALRVRWPLAASGEPARSRASKASPFAPRPFGTRTAAPTFSAIVRALATLQAAVPLLKRSAPLEFGPRL